MNFYDVDQYPMEIKEILSQSGVFLIASIPYPNNKNRVGLFVEDDGNFFLKATFDSYWLDNLRVAASRAHQITRSESPNAEEENAWNT